MKKALSEIKEELESASEAEWKQLFSIYAEDERKGVQKLLLQFQKKQENLQKERERVEALCAYEKKYAKYTYICGIDEVGRGPVAGPLAVSGVVFGNPCYIKWLNDSKKITEKRRPIVAKEVADNSLFAKVEMLEADAIDEIGIAESLKRLFKKVIVDCQDSGIYTDVILIDGNDIDLDDERVHCVVKGDSKSASIASASVLAKVRRDELMIERSKEYPIYEWDKNKGYGTKSHLEMIGKHGVCEYHRKSFLSKYI